MSCLIETMLSCQMSHPHGSFMRLCKGVLGSRENGVKYFREQGAWGQKVQGAGSKGNHFREQGAKDSGYFIKQFDIIIRIFLCLASLA